MGTREGRKKRGGKDEEGGRVRYDRQPDRGTRLLSSHRI